MTLAHTIGATPADGKERFWLTPSHVYDPLHAEFRFDFDPCPCPRPEGYDSLALDRWPARMAYINPPFRPADGVNGKGPTAFVRKAIEENRLHGRGSVLLIPTQSYVNLLLEAGAECRSMGRVRWLEATTGAPCSGPSPITAFILHPRT